MTRAFPVAIAAALSVVLAGACSGDDAASSPTAGSDAAGSPTPAIGQESDAAASGSGDPGNGATITPPATSEPPVTGVPGLDSGDAFCSAWSRFGGSWQLLIQSATIDPGAVTRLEVIASTVVRDGFADTMAAWPSELASEMELVADGFFGPFQRRSEAAFVALEATGISTAEIAVLNDAWSDLLASYDPYTPTFSITLDPELDARVGEAATAFAGQRPPLLDDPSMVITAETPLTDAYLATACPDEGWIVGQDVVSGG